ncbi:MAG: hypothetical protein LUE64_01345 [Candidatus Gastranaerophilales bacterium]|nr:hypothetical protein [Candidatus Gastranaerophilales bacterium]
METKYYYSYNTAAKTYSGKHPALKNPQRPSEYLLPAKATFIEPPQTGTNEIAIWNGQNWDIESDFRGQTQVNIETKEISTIEYVGAIKDGFQKISEDMAEDIKTNPEKYKNIGGNFSDISNTDEYRQFLKEKETEARKTKIEQELSELDIKRIRAICESSIKDEFTGETWLDFYNKQVANLREELNKL